MMNTLALLAAVALPAPALPVDSGHEAVESAELLPLAPAIGDEIERLLYKRARGAAAALHMEAACARSAIVLPRARRAVRREPVLLAVSSVETLAAPEPPAAAESPAEPAVAEPASVATAHVEPVSVAVPVAEPAVAERPLTEAWGVAPPAVEREVALPAPARGKAEEAVSWRSVPDWR